MKGLLKKSFMALAIMLVGTMAWAQTRTISGKVTDSSNEPVAGAAVMVKGNTSIGTSTDVDGTYTLANVPSGSTLVFTFIGMDTEEVAVGNRSTIDVVMDYSTEMLEEMVVIGYGSIKKADLTGAVSVVSTEDFKNKANNSIADALQGMAAGVNVRSTGDLGGLPTVLIRGTSSLTDNTPLYIIDGIPTSNDIGFNVDDIESMQVLKDASAAAIYGSRAANGVIIITTKSGSAGPVSINVSNQTSIQWNHRLDLADAAEWTDIMTRVYQDGIDRKTTDRTAVPDFYTGNTDWQEEFFKLGIQQKNDISISGGSQNAKFRVSYGLLNNTGAQIGRNMQRQTVSINSTLTKGIFTFGESLQMGLTSMKTPNLTTLGEVVGLLPIVPIYDDSQYGKNGWGIGNAEKGYTTSHNIVAEANMDNGYNESQNIYMRGNAWMQVRIPGVKGLTYKLSLGASINDNQSKGWTTGINYALNFTDTNSTASQDTRRNTSYIIENTLNYDREIGKHTINAVLGQSYQTNSSISNSAARIDLISTSAGEYLTNVSSGLTVSGASGSTGQSRLISYFGRVNYSYDSRYLFQATVRADGSSRFAPGKKWGVFPSMSVGWRVSQEDFWNVSWMNDLKVRYSYGQLGSQNVGNYDWMSLINSYTSYLINGENSSPVPGQAVTEVSNADISWETLVQHNVGVDMAFLNNQLLVTAEYYHSQSRDCLFRQPILKTVGATGSPYVNSATLSNQGVELQIKWRQNVGKDFSYSVTANLAHNRNKLESLAYGVQEQDSGSAISRVGYPLGQFYAIVSDGLFQSDEEAQNYKNKDGKVIQPNAKAGDIKWVDYNGDGQINDSDRQILEDKSPWPGLDASLNIMMNYKGWELQISGFGEFFKWTRNGTRAQTDALTVSAQRRTGLNWWTPSNKHNDVWYPRQSWGHTQNDLGSTDRWIERGDFFKFNSISLGYNWTPKGVVSTVIKNLRASVTAQNLLTLTSYTGYDPDFTGGIHTPGNAGNVIANPYSIIFGLNVTF